jgi:undecaprenyl-diphosphatase
MSEQLYYFIIAAIQGFTEFLPISSSGHLVLLPNIFNHQDQGLFVDIAAHGGSLIAVLIYFHRDVLRVFCQEPLGFLADRRQKPDMLCKLFVASLPVVIIGFIVKDYSDCLRHPYIIATTTLVFGLLLYYAEKQYRANSTSTLITYTNAIAIGLAQCLALIPGTSRSGITITVALLLGINKRYGATFAMLLAIPVVVGALTLGIADLDQPMKVITSSSFWLVFTVSAIVAYLSLTLLFHLIAKLSLKCFAYYRILLAIVIFIWWSV